MGVHQDSDSEVYDHIKRILDIPPDEPIFILRAQDKFAPISIENYLSVIENYLSVVWYGVRTKLETLTQWREDVRTVVRDFRKWQEDNPEKVKVPD